MNPNALPRSLLLVLIILFASLAAGGKGPWKDMYLEVGDIKIHYLEAGTGDRTLVFLPGWTLNAEIWREQIPYFSVRGFRVLALDPRSHGQTTKTETGNTCHQQAADLHAFLRSLKISRSCLVGWGSGAAVLLEYISSPETYKPEKIILVDGYPAGIRTEERPGAQALRQARTLLLGLQDDRAKATDRFVRGLFKTRQPEYLYKQLTDSCLKTPIGAAASLYFDLFTGDRKPALARVEVPTLIVTSPENRAIGEFMQSVIARSSLEVIDEAGAAMFLERPQAFNQILEAFLGEQ
jgi:pimeloyl-ACP methyl ester carboxylesterase